MAKVDLPKGDEEKVLNLAQDVIGVVSRQTLPKHVGIALHILKETCSKNLVMMLNKFGNSISYSSAQRYITTFANDVSKQEQKDGVFIPTNIVPCQFTQYTLGNLNFHSETEDGGSLDATTNIIYQHGCGEKKGREAGTVSVKKSRKLTIEMPEKFVAGSSKLSLKYRKKARSLRDIVIKQGEKNECRTLADKNVVWFLVRTFPTEVMVGEDDASCSLTWNSFFETCASQHRNQTKIAYGPMFPQIPTNPDVVQASLDYFISLSIKLGQSKTVVACDQAIYDIIKGLATKEIEK